MAINYAQLQLFTVAGAGSNIGDVSITLTSFNDIDGNALNMTAFGSKGYGTLEPSSGTQEEQISFTGITNNSNGTVTLAGVSHVAFLTPYTETAGMTKSHAGGVRFTITNTSGFYGTFANKNNNETVVGTWTFSTLPLMSGDPTLPLQAADKHYVDNVAIAGAPNADTVTKGNVQIATGAQLAAGTAIGTTGASVVPNGGSFKSSSAGAGDANKVPVLNGSGKLDSTFQNQASTTVQGEIEIATATETASGTATGGTGAALVPANSSFKNLSAGSADINKVPVTTTGGVLDPTFIYSSFTSGEALTIGQPVYLKASDSRVYRTNATANESTFSFTGFAMDTVGAAGTTVRVALPGSIATGLAGLTPGSYYFLADAVGTVATTPGTKFAKIGQALSTTTMRMIEPKFFATGLQTFVGVTTAVQTCGFYPAKMTIAAENDRTATTGASFSDSGGGISECKLGYAPGVLTMSTTVAGESWRCYDYNTAALNGSGSVSAKTATGFTLSEGTHSGGTTTIRWTVESL